MANCEYCKADCAHIGEHQVKACKGYIPQTNGDSIRAMSDEELAKAIIASTDYFEENEALEWLKQPAEVDHERD